jgi:hypothetical protein
MCKALPVKYGLQHRAAVLYPIKAGHCITNKLDKKTEGLWGHGDLQIKLSINNTSL